MKENSPPPPVEFLSLEMKPHGVPEAPDAVQQLLVRWGAGLRGGADVSGAATVKVFWLHLQYKWVLHCGQYACRHKHTHNRNRSLKRNSITSPTVRETLMLPLLFNVVFNHWRHGFCYAVPLGLDSASLHSGSPRLVSDHGKDRIFKKYLYLIYLKHVLIIFKSIFNLQFTVKIFSI